MVVVSEKKMITLEYLKGKRRAEKALGFLVDVGPRILACETSQQVAQTISEHLIRLNIDLCWIDYRTSSGALVEAAAQALDLDDVVQSSAEITKRCREEAKKPTSEQVEPLDHSEITFEAEDGRVVVRRFRLDHPHAGSGVLCVARIRGGAPDFASAELTLLRDVAARFLIAVRCLPGSSV